MANKGDKYTVKLKKTHLEWGNHRYTNSRGTVYGEGYIPIPAKYARRFEVKNSNATKEKGKKKGKDVLGINTFNCESKDGFFSGTMKAQGNSKRGSTYAKNLSASGDLKVLGDWFRAVDAEVGDAVKVKWKSSKDMTIKLIKN